MDPALPPMALPVPMEMSPDAPELEVPDCSIMAPLTPAVPAFAERIPTEPDDLSLCGFGWLVKFLWD